MKLSVVCFSFLLVTLAGSSVCSAQNTEGQGGSIGSALNSRNATVLSQYFCNSIELQLPGVDGTYSKTQARNYLSEFFSKSQPRSFEIIHQGMRENVSFVIGRLVTASTAYRVNMLLKKEDGTMKIYQLRIE